MGNNCCGGDGKNNSEQLLQDQSQESFKNMESRTKDPNQQAEHAEFSKNTSITNASKQINDSKSRQSQSSKPSVVPLKKPLNSNPGQDDDDNKSEPAQLSQASILTPDNMNKYDTIMTQIQILKSDKARQQSLILCTKPEKIYRDGRNTEFGFLKYLNTELDEETAEDIFDQAEVENIKVAVSEFIEIMKYTVIEYQTKLHELRTGSDETSPKLNQEKIKSSVRHLAIWCFREFGEEQDEIEYVNVTDDKSNEMEEEADNYELRLDEGKYLKNVSKWVQKYVDENSQQP
eukprot:CAMPEP_0201571622 /NCGR_PEP_ID=MMETSP0190_2-20130828/14497_1 /ASSEMBLY_ACC=CAM_ASM_000263 /TAXON_ID=37353 /ORGANISM="Rosalina sp." /LENGTH=288 /DNA_ID=CAMNT_0047996461 /DNA_START=11 /DNA_END=877 /DNA_ORIENTATION=+